MTNGKTDRGEMVEMLKREWPKIDAHGKYGKPTNTIIC